MADKRRFPRLPVGIRVVLIIAVLYGLWRLPQSDQFLNGLLAFLFAGAIPGTDIVLSPESMLKAVVIAAASFVFVVIVASAYSVWRKRRIFDPGSAIASAEPPQPAEDMKPPRPAVAPAKVKKQPKEDKVVVKIPIPKQRSAFNLWLRGALRAASPALSSVLRRAHRRVVEGAPIVKAAAKTHYRRVARDLHSAGKVSYVTITRAAKWCAATITASAIFIRGKGVAFWKRAVPYLWRLDAWFEKQTRRAIALINRKISNNENARFVLLLTRRSIDHVRSSKPLSTANNTGQQRPDQDKPEAS